MPVIKTFGDAPAGGPTVDMDVLRRVNDLSSEGALVVEWALRMEGILHRIEEFPAHESSYPEDERFSDPRELARAVLRTSVTCPLAEQLRSYVTKRQESADKDES